MKINRKNLISENSGFTLTELTVVLVLLSLIAIFATSITLMANRSQQISQIDANGESDIIKLESAFKDWLTLYDYKDCKIEISHSKMEVQADESEIYMEFSGYTLSSYSGIAATTLSFSAITNITFELYNGNIICCTASFENTNFRHKILYHMRAAEIKRQNNYE